MKINRADIEARFHRLSDDALIQRQKSGELTELANEVALAELSLRGITVQDDEISEAPAEEIWGKLLPIARYDVPTEAMLLKSLLESKGVPAFVADVNMVQAYHLLSIALGGVRVMVPERFETQARNILEALNRGDYRLNEGDEVESLFTEYAPKDTQ